MLLSGMGQRILQPGHNSLHVSPAPLTSGTKPSILEAHNIFRRNTEHFPKDHRGLDRGRLRMLIHLGSGNPVLDSASQVTKLGSGATCGEDVDTWANMCEASAGW